MPAGFHVAILYQFLSGIILQACNPIAGEVCIKKCSGKKSATAHLSSCHTCQSTEKSFCRYANDNIAKSDFFFFNVLTVIYTRGWISSLSECGLNCFWVNSQLLCGTAAITKEAGNTLEEALRDCQHGFEHTQGLKMCRIVLLLVFLRSMFVI